MSWPPASGHWSPDGGVFQDAAGRRAPARFREGHRKGGRPGAGGAAGRRRSPGRPVRGALAAQGRALRPRGLRAPGAGRPVAAAGDRPGRSARRWSARSPGGPMRPSAARPETRSRPSGDAGAPEGGGRLRPGSRPGRSAVCSGAGPGPVPPGRFSGGALRPQAVPGGRSVRLRKGSGPPPVSAGCRDRPLPGRGHPAVRGPPLSRSHVHTAHRHARILGRSFQKRVRPIERKRHPCPEPST